MAQPLSCDICQAENGVQMLTNLQDGSTLVIGAQCLPAFYGHSLLTVMEAGEHKGPPTKCQACRRIHEQMAVLTAAAAEPVPDPAGLDDEPVPDLSDTLE